MQKLAFMFGIALTVIASAGIARAANIFEVDSLKVGRQGEGGVTYFNGTLINETTGTSGEDIPLTVGDSLRVDGVIHRGAASPGDSTPIKLRDDVQAEGSVYVTNTLWADDVRIDGYSVDASLGALTDNINSTNDTLSSTVDVVNTHTDNFDSILKLDETQVDVDLAIIGFLTCVERFAAISDRVEYDDWKLCKDTWIDTLAL